MNVNDQGSYVTLDASWADDPWFRFPRAFIRDARLSATARVVAAWMASHSGRYRFDVPAMVKAGLGGRDKVRKALKELEKYGYLVRERERGTRGRMGCILYRLYPVPQQNPSSEPAPENQGVVDEAPGPETQALDATSEDAAKPQVSTSDWKPGPGFQEGYKETRGSHKQEGEEVARARASDASADEGWGVPAASESVPSTSDVELARVVVTATARETGLGLEPWQHKALVTELMPAALTTVREQLAGRATEGDFCEWLRGGHATTDSLYAVMSTRCRADYLVERLPGWVAKQRQADLVVVTEPEPKRRRPGKPPWCGQCQAEGRRMELLEDGRERRCPRCHPLVAAEPAF